MNETAIIDWSWQVLSRTLASLLAGFGWAGGVAGFVPRGAWTRALAELRLMEATARRLLVAMAARLELSKNPIRTVPRSPKPAQKVPKTPGFALFDALPDPLVGLDDAQTSAPGHDASLPKMVNTDSLAARLDALSAVLTNPAPAARRMALWLARRKRRRTTPIRLGRLPRTRAGVFVVNDPLLSGLADAHALAVSALNRGPPKWSANG